MPVAECDESTGCTHEFVNGVKYKILSSGDVVLIVAMGVIDKYLWANVTVYNSRTAPIDVLPIDFSLMEMQPKQRLLGPVDIDKAIRSAQKRVAWGNALTAMGGSMARQQSTTTTTTNGSLTASSGGTTAYGTYSGSSVSRTTTPDYAAQSRAQTAIQQRNAAMASLSEQANSRALRANTVQPEQGVRGVVLFERDKKAKSLILSAHIGGTTFRFPFDFTK